MSRVKIEHRVMGDYSISKSYKGILRIAHIMENVDEEKDIFNNNVYYGSPSSLMNISGSASSKTYGYPNPSEAFEGKINRYISEKEYKDKKLPVTDSMGNYMNWNLGTDDSTIGSDMENNGFLVQYSKHYQKDYDNHIYQPVLFPVLESKELIIGLESKLIPNEKKHIKDSLLNIHDDEKTPMFIISNLFDHSEKNIEEIDGQDFEKFKTRKFKKATYHTVKDVETGTDDNGNPIYELKDVEIESEYRTIYKNTKNKVEEYDAFAYCQEDYNYNNFNYVNVIENDDIDYNKSFSVFENQIIDSEVDILNLKDYVKTIINKYMKSNVVEVPTGTVIWQYISPEKWYAKSDSGSGNELNSNNFIGHRPSMQQRNYESNQTKHNTDEEVSNKWISSTIQGASFKINKLNLGDGVQKQKTEEDENDSSYDSSKLSEIIPLYKRDYLLCDGSLYYIYLVEYNSYRNEIKRQNLSYDRFINLFYNIGYYYSSSKDSTVNPFSDIKNRYRVVLERNQSGDVSEMRFANSSGDPINSTNYMDYENTGALQVVQWSENRIKNLKESETLYSVDMGTMMAFNVLMEEDRKDVDSAFVDKLTLHYSRKKAEEWLKNQKIPNEFIFNSFVGDTEESFNSYKRTAAAQEVIDKNVVPRGVMEIPYKYLSTLKSDTFEQWPKVLIGREVNSFNSLIKYFVPGASSEDQGEYYICCLWEIPEIQYLLDVMEAGSGERSKVFQSIFKYTFRVPNLSDTNVPKFIGSSGFDWRDQNGNMLQSDDKWNTSMTAGSYSHRHAIFKGLISGFRENENLAKFKGHILTNSSEMPSASVNYHSYSEMLPVGGRGNSYGYLYDDNTGSYLFNELGTLEGLQYKVENVSSSTEGSGFSANILQRGPFNIEADGDTKQEIDYNMMAYNPRYYHVDDAYEGCTGCNKTEPASDPSWVPGLSYYLKSYKGGGFGKFIAFKKALQTFRTVNSYYTSKVGPPTGLFQKTGPFRGKKSVDYPSEDTTDGKKYIAWLDAETESWFSFSMADDPRFATAEPNRCLTGPPIKFSLSSTANYTKSDLNKDGNPNGSCHYFAPENVKCLPLIKL